MLENIKYVDSGSKEHIPAAPKLIFVSDELAVDRNFQRKSRQIQQFREQEGRGVHL